MRRKGVTVLLAAVMAASLIFAGCGKSESTGTAGGSEVGNAAAEESSNAGEVTTVDYVFWGNQT